MRTPCGAVSWPVAKADSGITLTPLARSASVNSSRRQGAGRLSMM
jgi:hypothetical protein